jgi:uncharacterized protein GlcG (DUF336 family)
MTVFNFKTTTLVAVASFLASAASAQVPLTERNVSMAMAQAIIAGAMEHCIKGGNTVAIVIVDRAGQVIASLRSDGAAPHLMEVTRMKAYTSLIRRLTTREFAQATASGDGLLLRQIPGVMALGGGVPIKIGNETIGAIGVGGAQGLGADEACANAGIEKIAAQLK